MLTMNIAVAGKVVPGPAGAPGTVTHADPHRRAARRGGALLATAQTSGGGRRRPVATQFVFNDPNVTFPIPAEHGIQVFAGYDEGPPKKKRPTPQ